MPYFRQMIIKAGVTDHNEIVELWELSVRATHHFLPEDYLQTIKQMLPSLLPKVNMYIKRNEAGKLVGFLGVADSKIEMLFIHPDCRGVGVGKLLTQFAILELKAD